MTRKISRKYLDGEFLYDYYFRVMGTAKSTVKLPAVCAARGMLNPKGNPPTQMACWKAIWLWACKKENHQKAYEIYNNALQKEGQSITMEDFKANVLRRYAISSYQFVHPSYRERFFKRNDL